MISVLPPSLPAPWVGCRLTLWLSHKSASLGARADKYASVSRSECQKRRPRLLCPEPVGRCPVSRTHLSRRRAAAQRGDDLDLLRDDPASLPSARRRTWSGGLVEEAGIHAREVGDRSEGAHTLTHTHTAFTHTITHKHTIHSHTHTHTPSHTLTQHSHTPSHTNTPFTHTLTPLNTNTHTPFTHTKG